MFCRKKVFGVEISEVANRLKRVLPKFRADRSHVRGVNGRSKFSEKNLFDVRRRRAASAGFAKRKRFVRRPLSVVAG